MATQGEIELYILPNRNRRTNWWAGTRSRVLAVFACVIHVLTGTNFVIEMGSIDTATVGRDVRVEAAAVVLLYQFGYTVVGFLHLFPFAFPRAHDAVAQLLDTFKVFHGGLANVGHASFLAIRETGVALVPEAPQEFVHGCLGRNRRSGKRC